MIVYNENDKTLIIPNGLGNLTNTESKSYEEGYADGKAAQRAEDAAKLEERTFVQNGVYTPEYGYKKVRVDVDTTGAYDEGYNAGKEAQRAEDDSNLEEIVITENGEYVPDYGYSNVIVNVPGAVDLYANVNAMFADMMLKMATYEYVSMYEIRSTFNTRTYIIPEDSIAVVSTYEKLEPFKTAGTYELDNNSTFITLYSHNKDAVIETSGTQKKISLFNTAPWLYANEWEEMHLYNTGSSDLTLQKITYCHTQTPPTVGRVSTNSTIYYPKGADYSSFIARWSSVATILPFEY